MRPELDSDPSPLADRAYELVGIGLFFAAAWYLWNLEGHGKLPRVAAVAILVAMPFIG